MHRRRDVDLGDQFVGVATVNAESGCLKLVDTARSLDKSLLGSWERAADALDGIQCEYRLGILVRSMEVWPMVRRADFHEHPDDDSEEPRQLWHVVTLHRPHLARLPNDLPLSRERRTRCSLYLDRPAARRLQRLVRLPISHMGVLGRFQSELWVCEHDLIDVRKARQQIVFGGRGLAGMGRMTTHFKAAS
jgi:hypothetical protein